MPESEGSLDSVVQRVVALLLDAHGKERAKLSLFIGAGVSREYGIPTTLGFARRFFEDALSGVSEDVRAAMRSAQDEEQIREFVNLFKAQLDSDLAYAFFKRVEQECISQTELDEIITYDRIIDLWRNGYLKVVVTTNFDGLIERKVAAQRLSSAESSFDVAILDYHDLARSDRPAITSGAILVKIAGQIERSNMLWTEEDFRNKLTDEVLKWLSIRIADTPVLMLGYTASERPLADLLAAHDVYAASVTPRPLTEIKTLAELATRRAHLHDHVRATASDFVAALYESLYERTKDPNLALSFRALQDRIEKLDAERTLPPQTHNVPRIAALKTLQEFSRSKDPAYRCFVLLGESGHGKSTLVRSLAEQSVSELAIYIPGNELNSTIDEWLSRLDNIDVGYICRLTRLLAKNVVLIIDGLNECLDTTRAKAILQDAVRLLDLYSDGHVRTVVTSRTDYWTRLRFDFGRKYVQPPLELASFNDQELAEAVQQLGNQTGLELPRWQYVCELLRIPQLYGFFAQLSRPSYAVGAETSLYRALRAQRESGIAEANRTLVWLCSNFRQLRSLSVPLADRNIDSELRAGIGELTSVGMLRSNRFDTLRFAEDRMAEFIFGELFLYEYCWQDGPSRSTGLGYFFEQLIQEYRQLGRDVLEYKTHLLNSLIFFVARCSDDEIVLLYQTGSAIVHNLIRAAVVLRRQLGPRIELRNDPVLMAVGVLDNAQYEPLLELLLTTESAFFSAVPFNYGAKLFPDNFLDFIGYITDHLLKHNIDLERDREYSTLLINSLLIYMLRNGPEQLCVRESIRGQLQRIIERTPLAFLGARISEAIEENSLYLFHYHPTDKLSDLLHLDWYWRRLLIRALYGSGLDLSFRDVVALLQMGSAVRLLLRFVFCRDMYDPRLPDFVDAVFDSDDIVAQDFCLGILGLAGKQDAAFIPLSESCIIKMRTHAQQNFFRKTIGTFDGVDSQYDPLVPHVTTLMLRDLPVDLTLLLGEEHEGAAFRLGRFAQKTMLDFPDKTLALLYSFREHGKNHPEIRIALRAAARFSPASFWKIARQWQPEDLFESETDDLVETTRIVAQVRDFDWRNTVGWAIATPARKNAISTALVALLESDNLDTFFQKAVKRVLE